MTFVERKARLLDHRAGNADLADLAADVRDRLRAMHDPARHVFLIRVVVRGRDVVDEIRQTDGGFVHAGQCGLQRGAVRRVDEFVAVQRQHEVPVTVFERTLDELRHLRALIEDGLVVVAQLQRQSFVGQFAQDLGSRVRAAMVENVKTIEECRVVPDEGLDDVALVANRGDGGELHLSTTGDLDDRSDATRHGKTDFLNVQSGRQYGNSECSSDVNLSIQHRLDKHCPVCLEALRCAHINYIVAMLIRVVAVKSDAGVGRSVI